MFPYVPVHIILPAYCVAVPWHIRKLGSDPPELFPMTCSRWGKSGVCTLAPRLPAWWSAQRAAKASPSSNSNTLGDQAGASPGAAAEGEH